MSQAGDLVAGFATLEGDEELPRKTTCPYKDALERFDLFTPPGSPFPAWAAHKMVPVVEATTQGYRYHAPDLDAREPAPACYADEAGDEHQGNSWKVKEQRFSVGWRTPCRCYECREAFDRMGLDIYDDDFEMPSYTDGFDSAVVTTSGGRGTAHAPADGDVPAPHCGHYSANFGWEVVEEGEEEKLTRCLSGSCQAKFAWIDEK